MGTEVTRTFDLLSRQLEMYNKEDALAAKENGIWVKYSTADYIRNANLMSYGFLSLGIKKEDKVITVSNNRPEWNFVDMGLSQIGAIHVPVYPTISADEYRHILKHSDARIVIVSDKLLHKKIAPIVEEIEQIEAIYSFNDLEGVKNWKEIRHAGEQHEAELAPKVEQIKASIKPEEVVSIIYTSGTTGISKGVMLTHNNFVTNMKAPFDALPLDHTHRVLSFLPLCHVYERLITYLFQYKGVSIYYAQNMGTIVTDLQEVKPHGFDTVPRLLEKVYDSIMSKGKALTGIKKKMFDWAVQLGLKYELDGKNGLIYETKLKIARKLVFSKWQEALGGNIRFIGAGGAALQERLARIFWAAGIPIQEGYGLTETSPLIAFNWYKTPGLKFGTVGPVVKGVTVKIADDGEILVKGPNIMKGYYKNEELTKEVIDSEGWFHTGDVGILEEGKYLKITDRKKEIFKMSSGKYVAPQVIENKLKESEFVEQAMVVGENQKFVSALISPNIQLIKELAKKKAIIEESDCALLEHPEIKTQFQLEVEKLNKQLGKTEIIKRFQIVCEEWSPDTGELSPTLKLKRKYINQKYESVINKIYRQ